MDSFINFERKSSNLLRNGELLPEIIRKKDYPPLPLKPHNDLKVLKDFNDLKVKVPPPKKNFTSCDAETPQKVKSAATAAVALYLRSLMPLTTLRTLKTLNLPLLCGDYG